MKRTVAITLALVTLIAAVGVGPAAALGAGDAGTTTAVDGQNETNESDIEPGAQLSAVVNVQEAEIDGDIESRAFGIAVAQAASNESKADVVAERLETNRERLKELQQRKQELKEQRKAGNISEGEYKAKMAKIAAETATIQRTTNQSANVTEGLPAALLEEHGINASAIQQLKENASELSGGEVSEIARSIAGERTGQAGGAPEDVGERGEAGDRGDGEDAGNTSEQVDRAAQEVQRASERIETAEQQVGENDTEAQAALEDAREALSNAEAALAEARSLAEDDPEAASERAQDALDHAETAISHAEEAMELASGGDGTGDGSGDGTGGSGDGTGDGSGDGSGTDGTESGTDTSGTDGDDGA